MLYLLRSSSRFTRYIIKIFLGSSTFTLDIISSALIGNIYFTLSSALRGNIYLTLSSAIIGNIYLTISSALIGNLGWDNETSLSLKYRKIVLISFSWAINREHLSTLHFTLFITIYFYYKQLTYQNDTILVSDMFGLVYWWEHCSASSTDGILLNFILSARLCSAEKTCKNLAYLTLLNIGHKIKVGDHEKLVGECILGFLLWD